MAACAKFFAGAYARYGWAKLMRSGLGGHETLANPPFMSPKGGINPHNRFSIQAKRNEVLFVDYMAEHLTPNGRAGIIVPEGIIFQSQGAYKQLRKLLVETSLVAVVSLPAGCFNPYSGVKTSILILDKSLARQSDTIAFFKVENDGFGLGAQRRAIEKNDLPQVQAELAAYLQALRSSDVRAKGPASSQPGATPQENGAQNLQGLKARPISTADGSGLQSSGVLVDHEPGALPQAGMGCAVGAQFTCGLIVPKEKIAANGDYNLSGERYWEGSGALTTFPRVRLADVCEAILTGPFGSSLHESDYVSNGIPVINPKKFLHRVRFKVPFEPSMLVYLLQEMALSGALKGWLSGTTIKHLTLESFNKLPIPLPPLATQQAIVAEIEAEQALVAANRELITRFEKKIQATLARVWGEDSNSANGAPPSQPGATPQEPWPKTQEG